MEELSEIGGTYYGDVPQTEFQLDLQLAETGRGKERYCKREGHRDSDSYKVGNTWVSLCPQCHDEIFAHISGVLTRHASAFGVVDK